MEETNQTSERVYFADRLNEAYEFRPKVLSFGKIYITIATIIVAFIMPPFAIIGFLGFWGSYFMQGSQLKKIEKEFLEYEKDYEVTQDITDFQLLIFKYGSILAFVFSILYVVGWITYKFLQYMWRNS